MESMARPLTQWRFMVKADTGVEALCQNLPCNMKIGQ